MWLCRFYVNTAVHESDHHIYVNRVNSHEATVTESITLQTFHRRFRRFDFKDVPIHVNAIHTVKTLSLIHI